VRETHNKNNREPDNNATIVGAKPDPGPETGHEAQWLKLCSDAGGYCTSFAGYHPYHAGYHPYHARHHPYRARHYPYHARHYPDHGR